MVDQESCRRFRNSKAARKIGSRLNRNPVANGRRTESTVPARQGQFPPKGQFQIRGVVHAERLAGRKSSQVPEGMGAAVMIDDHA